MQRRQSRPAGFRTCAERNAVRNRSEALGEFAVLRVAGPARFGTAPARLHARRREGGAPIRVLATYFDLRLAGSIARRASSGRTSTTPRITAVCPIENVTNAVAKRTGHAAHVTAGLRACKQMPLWWHLPGTRQLRNNNAKADALNPDVCVYDAGNRYGPPGGGGGEPERRLASLEDSGG